jgi:hypothetical protein
MLARAQRDALARTTRITAYSALAQAVVAPKDFTDAREISDEPGVFLQARLRVVFRARGTAGSRLVARRDAALPESALGTHG